MLISDSMPLLWLIWFVLSLIVLVFGYFAISFIPRLPRWLITAMVAGCLWMPAHFTVPGPESELGYSGWAPALVVAAVGVLQRNSAQLFYAGSLMLAGAALCMLLVALWCYRRGGDNDNDNDKGASRGRRDADREAGTSARRRSGGGRQEPSLGR
ncbi:hypothetical protein [Kushneria aurantia]|uniref:Uncharacterized protein n=1 Tax=Kushneria aurantia TaxID=504092 RepID=A0ABV6G7P3_9GAMM|nr:hypothetical protein [Kushneria aurantia]